MLAMCSKRTFSSAVLLLALANSCNARGGPFIEPSATKSALENFLARGGGSPTPLVTKDDEIDITFESILKGKTDVKSAPQRFLKKVTSPERLPYTISFLLSAVYGYFFVTRDAAEVQKCKFYTDGFCVTNLVDTGEVSKDKVPIRVCPSPNNSHQWAWYEDVIFTLLSIAIPFTKFKGEGLTFDIKASVPLIIFGHGYLHKWISSQKCSILDQGLVEMGIQFYKIFVNVLTGIMFFIFSDLPSRRPIVLILAEVLFISKLIVNASLDKVASGNAISTLFLVSQLLIGYLGAVAPGTRATKLVGQTFIFPCLVSLLEFLNCDFLNKIGGHALYDFALHISVLASLLPSTFEKLKEKLSE
mmetsp:Transcript_21054/g.29716  ORF Transcript_21054/g.29716 Transcript_21054/m.29716 type:complete len:359 (-) Transcript_21054:171-1247(-)